MRYAVIAFTGDVRGYTIKRSILARRHHVLVGSCKECQEWIAGYKQAMVDQDIERLGPVTLSVLPWADFDQAS